MKRVTRYGLILFMVGLWIILLDEISGNPMNEIWYYITLLLILISMFLFLKDE